MTITVSQAEDPAALFPEPLEKTLDDLRSYANERWLRTHPAALAVGRLRDIRVVAIGELVDLTEALDDGLLSIEQAYSLAALGLIVGGREGKGDDSVDAYIACSVGDTLDARHVTQAAQGASLLRVLGYKAWGIAAGSVIAAPVRAQAREMGVEVYERQSA